MGVQHDLGGRGEQPLDSFFAVLRFLCCSGKFVRGQGCFSLSLKEDELCLEQEGGWIGAFPPPPHTCFFLLFPPVPPHLFVFLQYNFESGWGRDPYPGQARSTTEMVQTLRDTNSPLSSSPTSVTASGGGSDLIDLSNTPHPPSQVQSMQKSVGRALSLSSLCSLSGQQRSARTFAPHKPMPRVEGGATH